MFEGGKSTCNAKSADQKCYHENLQGYFEYYITSRNEWKGEHNGRQLLDVALCSGLLRFVWLSTVENRVETKMIRCLVVAPYQSRKSREQRIKGRRCFTTVWYLGPLCVQAHPPSTFWVIKWKVKKQLKFLYNNVVFLCYASQYLLYL